LETNRSTQKRLHPLDLQKSGIAQCLFVFIIRRKFRCMGFHLTPLNYIECPLHLLQKTAKDSFQAFEEFNNWSLRARSSRKKKTIFLADFFPKIPGNILLKKLPRSKNLLYSQESPPNVFWFKVRSRNFQQARHGIPTMDLCLDSILERKDFSLQRATLHPNENRGDFLPWLELLKTRVPILGNGCFHQKISFGNTCHPRGTIQFDFLFFLAQELPFCFCLPQKKQRPELPIQKIHSFVG